MDFEDLIKTGLIIAVFAFIVAISSLIAFGNVVDDCEKFEAFSVADKVYECREVNHDSN